MLFNNFSLNRTYLLVFKLLQLRITYKRQQFQAHWHISTNKISHVATLLNFYTISYCFADLNFWLNQTKYLKEIKPSYKRQCAILIKCEERTSTHTNTIQREARERRVSRSVNNHATEKQQILTRTFVEFYTHTATLTIFEFISVHFLAIHCNHTQAASEFNNFIWFI